MKCKVEKICGGCSLLKLKPSMQADKKKKDVEELVEKAHLKVRVGDVHMAKNDTHYRNKVIVGFAKDKGKVYSGLYAPHSHRVVKTENCIMQPKLVNEIMHEYPCFCQIMKNAIDLKPRLIYWAVKLSPLPFVITYKIMAMLR